MPRLLEQPLEIHTIVAERRQSLRARHLHGARKLVGRPHDTHAFSAAACNSFHEQRVSNGVRIIAPRHHGDACRNRNLTRRRLAPHLAHRLRVGSDEREACLRARLGKLRVLGEKPVTRMHPVGTGSPGHVDDPIDPKVAFRCLIRPDGVRLICKADVKRIAIALRVNRNGPSPSRARPITAQHLPFGDQQLFSGQKGSSAYVILSPAPTYELSAIGFRAASGCRRPEVGPGAESQSGMSRDFRRFFSRLSQGPRARIASASSSRLITSSTNPCADTANGWANFSETRPPARRSAADFGARLFLVEHVTAPSDP